MPRVAVPKVGQVWADNDSRMTFERRGTIVGIEGNTVLMRWATDWSGKPVNRVSKIRIDRLKPTSTGYRLVQEAP